MPCATIYSGPTSFFFPDQPAVVSSQRSRFIPFFFLANLLVLLASCKSGQYLPTEKDATLASSHWSGTSLESLREGYHLFSAKCGGCHELYKPSDYSEDDWADLLPKMGRKAHLGQDQVELIRRYILSRREALLASKK